MINYQELLKKHHLKSSTQRIFILQSLFERGHATIEEIYADLLEYNTGISITAIYRNIAEMQNRALLNEVKIPKLKVHYEIHKESHMHLVCRECGKIEDASVDLEPMINSTQKRYGCQVVDEAIVLNVVCKDCLENTPLV